MLLDGYERMLKQLLEHATQAEARAAKTRLEADLELIQSALEDLK